MKKLLLTFGFVASGYLIAIAQKYEEAKTMMMLNQFDKAKESVDKNWTNAKYLAKPEAFILKSSIIANLGSAPDKGDAGKTMMMEADDLYQQYLKMDEKKTLIKDPAYQNTPILLYTSFINQGIALYNAKDYPKAVELFDKSIWYSSFLNETGIAVIPLDTTGHLLAGAAAQNIGDEKYDKIAMGHYKKLADVKMAGDDGNTIYRFLARKSFDFEDIDGFKKYMAIGKELYPNEEFYGYEEEDFLFSIEDVEEKRKRIEKKIASDPNNYKVQAAYGEYIFDLLNPRDSETKLPENAGALEAQMVSAFEKVGELQPESPLSYLNLANHFMNKSIRSNNKVVEHQTMMREKQKANTPEPVKGKPAPKPPAPDPADVEKRKELQAVYEAELVKAGKYYESVVKIYEKKTELTNMDKQNFRNAVSYMIDINKDLKNAAIRDKNAADENKFAAEEKRYMALYASLNK
jgi:hypothetical protein